MKDLVDFLKYVVDGRKVKKFLLNCLVALLMVLTACRVQFATDQKRWETERDALLEEHTQAIEQLKGDHAAELAALVEKTEAGIYTTQHMPQEYTEEAKWIAVWLGNLQALYPGLTPEARALACWGVFCRMENDRYPDTALEVLKQRGQFNEFDDSGTPTEENAAIASNQIARWASGDIRPCGMGAVYISVSRQGVVLRDTFEQDKHTNYWRA